MNQSEVKDSVNILILSDLHINHVGGLMTPDDDIIPNPESSVRSFAEITFPERRKLWNKFIENIKACNCEFDAVILLAELIDLPHKRNSQNTVHPNSQIDELAALFVNVIKFLPLKQGAIFYGCLGSRFHVTIDNTNDIERNCYREIKHLGYDVELNFAQKPVDLDIFDHRIRAWHKITGSAEKNIVGNIIKELDPTAKEKAPSVLFTGHWHKGETYQKQFLSRCFDFIKCPCLCLPIGDLTRLMGNNEFGDANYALGFRTLKVLKDGTLTHKMYHCEVRGQRAVKRLV